MGQEFKLRKKFVWQTLSDLIKEFQSLLKFYKEKEIPGVSNVYDVSIKGNTENGSVGNILLETEQGPVVSKVNYTPFGTVAEIISQTSSDGSTISGEISLMTYDFASLKGGTIFISPYDIKLNTTDNITINNQYSLPLVDGSIGQVLTTNGAGVTSWSTPSSGFPLFYSAGVPIGDPPYARMQTSNTSYINVSEAETVAMVLPFGEIILNYIEMRLNTTLPIKIGTSSFNTISIDNQKLGFYNTAPIVKPTVTTGDINSLITALQQLGLINVV
jgi:hypothetical protein